MGARFRAAGREETGWAYLVVFVAGGEPEENLAESPMETWAPGVGRRQRSPSRRRERESDERKEGRATARAHGRSFTVGFVRRVTRHGVRFANVEPDPGIYPLVCWCYPEQSNQGTSEPTSTYEVETKSVHSKKKQFQTIQGPSGH